MALGGSIGGLARLASGNKQKAPVPGQSRLEKQSTKVVGAPAVKPMAGLSSGLEKYLKPPAGGWGAGVQKTAATAGPVAQQAQGSAPAASPGPSPLDATYFANAGANQFKVGQSVSALQLKESEASTALQDNLAKLAQEQQLANTNAQDKENSAGGYALGNLGQTLGNLNTNYLSNQAAQNRDFTNTKSTDDAQIAALQAGVPIYDAQQAAASVGRASALTAKDTTLGQTVPGPAAPAAPAAGLSGQNLRNANSTSLKSGVKGVTPADIKGERSAYAKALLAYSKKNPAFGKSVNLGKLAGYR